MSRSQTSGKWVLLRMLIDPGWAPIIVAVAFLVSVTSGFGERYDWVFHFAGGAAIAFFVARSTQVVPSLSEKIAPRFRARVSFLTAFAVAILWEVAEFMADRAIGTTFQHGGLETVRDIAYGSLGALVVSILMNLRFTKTET